MATLTVTSGPATGQSRPIEGEFVIGRGEADFVIDDPELSRRHVMVRVTGAGVVIEDLNSRNGTWVNGQRITAPMTVTQNARLKLGTSELSIELAPAEATQVRGMASAAQAAPVDVESDLGAREPEPAGQARPPGPLGRLLPIAAVLFVAGVVALVVLAETGDATKTRSLAADLDLVEVRQLGNKALLVGPQSGPPTGDGRATVDAAFRLTTPGPLKSDTAVGGKITSTFENGSMTSILQFTAKPQPDGGRLYEGRGTVTGGTGDYSDASGSFSFNGSQEPNSKQIKAELRGSVEY